MKESVSFWRRTAGLYLSAAPMDADDADTAAMPSDAIEPDASVLPAHGNRQQLYLLCEAIDLVVSAQGYNSPAVAPLLHALIGTVRLLRATPQGAAEQVSQEASEQEPTEPAKPAPEQAADVQPGGDSVTEPEQEPEATESEPPQEALSQRVVATERKVAALTDAVSRLVEHLERRRWTASPAERRGEVRLPGVDAAVFIDRQRYRVLDWSKSGFCIQVGEGELLGRRRFAFRFTLELLDETIEFQGFAIPMRREGTRFAARFVQLDRAVEDKLAQVVQRLAGGA